MFRTGQKKFLRIYKSNNDSLEDNDRSKTYGLDELKTLS